MDIMEFHIKKQRISQIPFKNMGRNQIHGYSGLKEYNMMYRGKNSNLRDIPWNFIRKQRINQTQFLIMENNPIDGYSGNRDLMYIKETKNIL